jgi:hypothetical protein
MSYLKSFILAIWLCPLLASAQNPNCEAKTLEAFFACYGGQSAFSTHSIKAITTFIQSEDALKAGDYVQAKKMIDDLFKTYPKGSNLWWNVFNDPNGANIGAPHAYYGLRMMEDIIDHGLHGDPNVKAKKVYMKFVLVGCSEGIQPNTKAELQNGSGTFITNKIHPDIKKDDYRIVKQSFELFGQYIKAITKGGLEIEMDFVELDQLCLPVKVTTTKPYLSYGGIEPVWKALSQGLKDSTDWWSIIYPSHVPEAPVFDDESFITGGMGADYKGGPVFISDDKWIVRKPAHLGSGKYSDIERRIYLPQWVQHEFFHHLYRIYPELALEVNGHDWFNLNFWPSDFEGQFETDYYSETLHKRLQVNCAPMTSRLITRVQKDLTALYNTLTIDELRGPYSLDVVQNAWHEANIIQENGKHFWKNKANVQWTVTPSFTEGKLKTSNDNPYAGQDFLIELYKTVEGDYVPGAIALKFNGESYKKRFNLLRNKVPMEISLGLFERVPKLNTQHSGNMVKTAGQFFWKSDAADNWTLAPNIKEENFSLLSGSPTPGEKFQLVLTESGCGVHALGFRYQDYYYWKPKRSAANGSPIVTKGLADLELPKNFGSHSINLADVFRDPEGDSLLLFVTSDQSTLVSADIDAAMLTLTGGGVGEATIYLMALDANGGLAVDDFKVKVTPTVSTTDAGSDFSISPRLTQDYIYIIGPSANYTLSVIAMDKSCQQMIPVSAEQTRVDLSHLPSGIYLLMITDPVHKTTKVEKVVKY